MFDRVAIVNRGEAAMRLIHAARELGAERGRRIEVVALYTDGEASARFVREADIAYPLGPGSARPYLDHLLLERALRETGADAAWVGWGFVAEDPTFAELCERIGVTFVGPSAESMRLLGDKIGSKRIAEEVGVPVAPWSGGPLDSLEQAREHAEAIGYPLMLKATAGGGGRGIRLVTSADDLTACFALTRDEARRAFGNGTVFLESMVTGARHVEVQIIADGHGTAWALGVRDCTLQRRNQKVIEESSSPVLDAESVATLRASAERLATRVGYCGAATVEFLYRPRDRALAFLEVNTRLQVEHPVTELVTGFDIVKAQLHVAAGGRLEGDPPVEIGHAVEARLNAEDPDRHFAPSPGRVSMLQLPEGPGVRVDTGLSAGDTIPSDFDSMIAKVIGYGGTRDEALARLRRALDDTHVIIEGGATNKTFLIELLEQREVLHATVDTGWIDRAREEGRLRSHDHSDVALVAAAIAAYEEEERAEQQRFLATAYGGRPQARHDLYRAFDLKLRHVAYQVQIAQVGPDRFRIGLGTDSDATVDASLERNDEHAARLTMGGQTYRLLVNSHGHEIFVEVDHAAHRITHDEGGVVRSHAPALVVAVPTQVGAQVEAGAPLVVLESMKMETTLTAPSAGRVREVLVSVGHQVETGEPLVRLEPLPDAEPDPDETVTEHVDGPGVVLETREQPTATQRATGALADLRGMLLGYDLPPELESIAVAEYRFARAELTTDDQTTLSDEIALLRAFTDIAELSRNRPAAGENQDRVHSPREHFHAYLRSLDPQREGLPETFSDRLRRALSHYGVAQLERTGELEEAVFRIFMALQTAGSHLRAVTAVLRQWLTQPTPQGPVAGLAHQALDELVIASQLRYPVVGDLARSVRFSWFDEPVVARERAMVLARAADDLAALTGGDEQNRAERIQSLVDIPEQLNDFLADQLRKGVGAQAPMLEVMLRRHYGEHHIGAVEVSSAAGHPFVVADYSIDARDCRVVATEAWLDDLDPGSGFATALGSLVADGVAAARDVVVDLYLLWPAAPADPDDLVAAAARLLDRLSFSRKVRRVMLGIVDATPEQSMMHLTFRPDRDRSEVPDPTAGVVEDDLIRGVHPMVARRLDLWRLRNFNVTRLEGTPNVLLYHCIAPNNPADQRLVALAQIRELAVVRDRDGRITGLPHVQRAVNTSMEMLRRARSRLGTKGARLDTNHVWLHIWPVVELPLTELTGLGHTISPLTAGRGVQEVVAQGQVRGPDGKIRPAAVRFTYQSGHGVVASISGPMTERLAPMDGYAQKVNQSRRRGYTYPYELLDEIVGPEGSFEEYELDGDALVAVDRPPGNNPSGLVVGVASTPTERYPEGIRRVVLLGDPTKALGSVAEPECARMVAALDLAETMGVPVDWYALSSGARISMESGTENMDWVARGLRRIIEFTQGGGVINVVVAGINVGAQPYWNAEATMLMHTRGVLVMTPDSAMVLTGKQSLDFSGGVSAEDNFGIGGYDRVMGPNGQAQYWAPDLPAAVEILRQCHDHAYRQPGEAVSRPAPTSDPVDRDVRDFGHHDPDSDFTRVGEIFSAEANPDRKKPFDIRTLMRAVADADHPVLERWANMADADTSVVFDAHLGGQPVCLLGIESRPIPRLGFPPSDGPDTWTAGTLFPRSSKKTARAVNAASGSRPLVVLANLSGFDGSPESMRNLQLEYGAEIGRAVVNFAGPIVFCVVSRYHGGAFVVFSKQLNDNMRVLAVEGSFASVIGGAPAAAVVFAGEVTRRTDTDPRVLSLEARVAAASGSARAALVQELADLRESVRTERLGEVAGEFDGIHDIARAVAVGSVDDVISAHELRPRLIAEVRAGIARLGDG